MNLQRIIRGSYLDYEPSYEGTECWIWKESKTQGGYGQFTEDGIRWLAHRYAWTCVNGEIPEGMVVRHMCHNSSCCNPSHLKVGSQTENWKDSEERYRIAESKRSLPCEIDGKSYKSLAEAYRSTGISPPMINRFLQNGVFDRLAYLSDPSIRNIETCTIGTTVYRSKKEASLATGINEKTIAKYVDHTGIFDIGAYRRGCRIGNFPPRL